MDNIGEVFNEMYAMAKNRMDFMPFGNTAEFKALSKSKKLKAICFLLETGLKGDLISAHKALYALSDLIGYEVKE